MSIRVAVVVQIAACGDRDCWCGVATDKHGKPLPIRRDIPMAQVPVALAGVELDGHRGHTATAWVDASAPTRTPARARNTRTDYQPLVRSNSWVTIPRTVRASSGAWRGESNGDRWERTIIERHSR